MCNKYIFQKTDIQNDDSETTKNYLNYGGTFQHFLVYFDLKIVPTFIKSTNFVYLGVDNQQYISIDITDFHYEELIDVFLEIINLIFFLNLKIIISMIVPLRLSY